MFGAQSSELRNQLVNDGMPATWADTLVRTIGQCMASLLHNGAVTLTGPFNSNGESRMRGPVKIGTPDSRSDSTLNVSIPATFTAPATFSGPATFTGEVTLPEGMLSGGFVIGELSGPLARDGTATLDVVGDDDDIEVFGYLVPVDWHVPSGARIGACWDANNEQWVAVAGDSCLEHD